MLDLWNQFRTQQTVQYKLQNIMNKRFNWLHFWILKYAYGHIINYHHTKDLNTKFDESKKE